MTGTTLEERFVDELRDIYDGERQMVKALPKLVQNASEEKLTEAFQHHLDQTRGHVERLERIFSELGESPSGKTCLGIQGLLEEGELAFELPAGPVRDAALIAGAQKVEHYEIATYGTLCAWAKELGHDDASDLLDETLDEEGEADKKLTDIAEGGVISSGVNEAAAKR